MPDPAAAPDPVRLATAQTSTSGAASGELLGEIIKHGLLDSGPALYVADLEGRLRWANTPFRRLAAAHASQNGFGRGVLPLAEIASEVLQRGGVVSREEILGRGPHAQRLRSRHVALRGAAGETAAIAGIVIQGADEATRFDAIMLLRERFDDIMRLVSDWVWETDADLVLTGVSHRVFDVLGFHPRELVGRSLMSLGRPDIARPAVTRRLKERSSFRNVAFEAATRSGEIRQFMLSAVPVFSHATGDFLGFRGTASDMTELRKRELGLQAAKEMAEAESRAKTEFLANVSHELRTPLNAIIGFAEIMRMELLGPIGNQQYHGYVGDIHDSACHLLGLINDILDVSKIEAGKADLIEQEVNFGHTIEAVMRLIRERAVRAQVTLEVDLARDLPPLLADDRKLKQILINLLSNSVKFTPAGGRAQLAARVDPASGDLLLVVSDTGIGIGPNDIRRVMEPFGQVDSRLSRRYDGTGLGLPLTRGLVELHGGTITLESQLGIGTTVTVRLPAARLLRR